MRPWQTGASILPLLTVVLAGCVGGSGSPESVEAQTALEFEVSDSTGAVHGVVTSTELQPIEGARVALYDLDLRTNTSSAGEFGFSRVPPGSHRLVVEALGFSSVGRSVDVASGEIADVRVTLEILPIVEPYLELRLLAGFAICDMNAIVLSFALTGPGCEQKKGLYQIAMVETWRYAVVEQVWNNQAGMHLVSDTDGTCLLGNSSSNSCFKWTVGRSPLRVDAAPNDTTVVQYLMRYPEGAFRWFITGFDAGLLQREIAGTVVCRQYLRPNGPECAGVAGSTGFKFDIYLSIFHNERPANPKAYAARPDG